MASRPKEAEERLKTNPEAEWLTTAEFDALVPAFYGLRVCMFDAALAKHVLDNYNSGNRRLSGGKVDRLVQQLKNGEFQNTGEPIILSREGVLNDGQHRLAAIIEADAVTDLDVRFGIPRSAFTKTDTGASRTGGDIISIAGASHGAAVAQAVRLLLLYERGLPGSIREFVSNDAISKGFERWPDIASVAEDVHGRAYPKGVRSTPLLVTAFLASRAPGKRKLGDWLDTLETGVGAGKGDPAHLLREMLIRGAEAPSGTREAQMERLATMIRSWLLYREGEITSAKDLRWTALKGGDFPKIKDAKL